MKKRFGVRTASTRLHEIPIHPDIRLFEQKMSYFLKISMAVAEILHKYVPPEGVHVYSDFNELVLHENYLLLMDNIRNRYGSATLLRAVSYTPAGTTVKRSKIVGGEKE